MSLEITLIPLSKIEPNPWNPNKQSERAYAAEIESIEQNGFLAPILVRAIGDKYQIIDGEHRWKALDEIISKGKDLKNNLPELAKKKHIPAVVIEASDAKAKKLTVVMNETRGRADMSSMAVLLSSLQPELGDDLIIGLPYTPSQLDELLAIANYDWEALTEIEYEEPEAESTTPQYKVNAILEEDVMTKWQAYAAEFKDELPKDKAKAAGIIIGKLLDK